MGAFFFQTDFTFHAKALVKVSVVFVKLKTNDEETQPILTFLSIFKVDRISFVSVLFTDCHIGMFIKCIYKLFSVSGSFQR